MDSSSVTRRDFLQTTGTAAVAAGVVNQLAMAPARAAGSNEKIRIGMVGIGRRGRSHIKALTNLKKAGANIEIVGVCDVWTVNLEKAVALVKDGFGVEPKTYGDYKEMLADKDIDAITIATPDHWHARQAIDAMKAGKNVYCEKPMTHTVQEAFDMVQVWKETGKVCQVGVQSTSLPVWDKCRELLQDGKLGKVLQFQTEFFRNSPFGQWRGDYPLDKTMNPQTVNWKKFLGVEEGLAADRPFDRAMFCQWRRFWDFGSGMYTDLFVHRTTSMLKATGLRLPGRVVGAGGIYLELDGRDVADVATIVADFHEGAQATITATMCAEKTPITQLIRGHFGSFVFGNGEEFDEFKFIPERPQVTKDSKLKEEIIRVGKPEVSTTDAHFHNFLEAVRYGKPEMVNNPPDLGAAAIIIVTLGAMSYRYGKVYHYNPETKKVSDGDSSWAQKWEKMSKEQAKPNHIPGWKAGDYGSLVDPMDFMALAGPWIDGKPPEETSSGGK